MSTYLIRRLIYLAFQALAVATVVFLLLRLVPGDPVRATLGQTATPEQVAEVRGQLGLDQPLIQQYGEWMGNLVRGDLGTAITSARPVSLDVGLRIGNTLELIVLSTVVALAVGIPLGVIAALRSNKVTDYALGSLAMLGLSLPSFVVGTVLLLIFALWLGWLPESRYVPWGESPVGHLRTVVLPVLTLAAPFAAVVMRMTRSSMLEVVRKDYVRTARAKGLGSWAITMRHALRNALVPVLSISGLEVVSLFGNTVLVEIIFSWPGLSSLLFDGVTQRDYPVVQGVVLVIAALVMLVNLIVDVTYGVLDPRIRNS